MNNLTGTLDLFGLDQPPPPRAPAPGPAPAPDLGPHPGPGPVPGVGPGLGSVVEGATVAEPRERRAPARRPRWRRGPGRRDSRDGERRSGKRRRPSLALPAHRATTRDACVLFPGVGSPCTGVRGPLLGADQLSGDTSFHFDLIEAYNQGGLIDNTNMFVLGKPGNGKSALIKTLVWRSLAIYGSDRFFCLIDVKGEYRDLAIEAGFTILDLRPDGPTRINPLGQPATPDDPADAARTIRHRVTMVAALCATQLGRSLTQEQEAVLYAAMEEVNRLEQTQLARGSAVQARLSTIARLLRNPTPAMAAAIYTDNPDTARAHTLPLAVALDGLLGRSMRGMFDGESPLRLDPTETRGLVIDLSAINNDDTALPLVMVAVTGWLRELMRANWGPVRKIQVFDEAWLVLKHEAIVRYLQDTWKLGRSYGFANIAILHRPSDLLAQTDAGTAAAAMAVGLLTDTDTIVSYAQNADELATHGELLGWTAGERDRIARLDRGESLWAIGEHHRVLLTHIINDGVETRLCDTDRKLAAHGPTP